MYLEPSNYPDLRLGPELWRVIRTFFSVVLQSYIHELMSQVVAAS